jgi:S1-C subfamily serine protease
MNKLKFAAIVAFGAAMALSPANIAAQEAAKPLGLGVNLDHTAEGETQVMAVRPGSTGAALGLKAGDILLEAGGRPMSSEVYNAYMKDKRVGDDLVFKVRREGASIELKGKGVVEPQRASAAQAGRPSN